MPDIDFQKIVLNLIPKKGDEPVIFYASQYETARPFIADLFWGDSEFAPGDDCWAEIDIRKVDDNLVVITDDVSIDNNEVSVVLPVQALTCVGKNFGQVKIFADDDHLVAALNFILEVQPDPLAGGVTSDTAIDNLTTQIEEIAQAEGYLKSDDVAPVALSGSYNDLTDKPTIPDMSNYYTKSETYSKTQVDDALALKANTTDLATVATTGDYDDLINKPDLSNYYTKSETDTLLSAKADASSVYTKAQVDNIVDSMLPVVSASGSIITLSTAITTSPFYDVTVDENATTITKCGKNLLSYTATSNTINDVAYTVNSDGTITANGTASAESTFIIFGSTGKFTKPVSYILNGSVGSFGNTVRMRFGVSGVGVYDDFGSGVSIPVIPDIATRYQYLQITVNNGVTVDNIVFKPMIRLSEITSGDYEQYKTETYTVANKDNIYPYNGYNTLFTDYGDISASAKDTIQHYIDERT